MSITEIGALLAGLEDKIQQESQLSAAACKTILEHVETAALEAANESKKRDAALAAHDAKIKSIFASLASVIEGEIKTRNTMLLELITGTNKQGPVALPIPAALPMLAAHDFKDAA